MFLKNYLGRCVLLACMLFLVGTFISCKHTSTANTAFYYWKTNYSPDKGHQQLLADAGGNHLYLRLFDIHWNNTLQHVVPNAILKVDSSLKGIKVTPVIFITNQTFRHTQLTDIDSLAIKSVALVKHIAQSANIGYSQIQIDCDWTDDTRDKYFAYLKAFKSHDGHLIEATIRLHQVKYRERTGIPPVERGILMFYNIGSISALGKSNSIYNENDAARYLNRLGTYPLPLDVALPLFSWAIHSRHGRIIQLYPQINRQDLTDAQKFKPEDNYYRALNSFFMKGVYVRESDDFKLEEIDPDLLKKATNQLVTKLRPLPNRTIIFYELANVNLSQFDASTFGSIADHF